MPPQINQPSRLNALFVVINYANSGLQFFLPNGTFYREVRLGAGPEDKTSLDPSVEPLWLPFKEPDDPKKATRWDIQQLSHLVKTLANSTLYLSNFIDMVQRASSAKTPAPSSYAEFRSALIGRPLALTYMAWSLELSGPEWTSQMDSDPTPSRTLLPPRKDDKHPPQQYSFPVQIGDEQRDFDGLVGYFLPKATDEVESGDALDLTKIYSHFAIAKPPVPTTTMSHDQPEGPIIPITSDRYPELRAHYIAPSSVNTPEDYAAQRDLELQLSGFVVGALVDLFLPCHAFTAILPPRELSLPPWTWQMSLAQMATLGSSSKKCSSKTTRLHHKKPARKRVCKCAGAQLPSSLMPSTAVKCRSGLRYCFRPSFCLMLLMQKRQTA
ncbi:hypothetical protein FOVG_18114 [Fusarium oxysporum f. sp. pisi HDV247]|uniref:Uncharacterized protein n=1 Tax=Fusarium oxysporum f. sp. pisi HDV247 TaxID=1080344 RepID=W9NRS9_FUSOX|nr:hypothetical protein FOVG_18114 [Fusarium oxysporum f. sp. pisi HDV247]